MNSIIANTIPVPLRSSRLTGVTILETVTSGPAEFGANVFSAETNGLAPLREVASWSDAPLISAVRGDPPDEAALDVLVARYRDSLFGRCQLLTLDREKAFDLAQAAWCRLLRARHALKPDGNFPAYLSTIATNLFRDSYRAARRAGPMAEYRRESRDVSHSNDVREPVALVEIVPDLKSLPPEDQTLLAIDLDSALEQLTPQSRDMSQSVKPQFLTATIPSLNDKPTIVWQSQGIDARYGAVLLSNSTTGNFHFQIR